jgi:hypothetical protein
MTEMEWWSTLAPEEMAELRAYVVSHTVDEWPLEYPPRMVVTIDHLLSLLKRLADNMGDETCHECKADLRYQEHSSTCEVNRAVIDALKLLPSEGS